MSYIRKWAAQELDYITKTIESHSSLVEELKAQQRELIEFLEREEQ